MQRQRQYIAKWDDEAGPQQSKPMSLAEANETAKRMRVHQALHVQVVPVPRPQLGRTPDWKYF